MIRVVHKVGAVLLVGPVAAVVVAVALEKSEGALAVVASKRESTLKTHSLYFCSVDEKGLYVQFFHGSSSPALNRAKRICFVRLYPFHCTLQQRRR